MNYSKFFRTTPVHKEFMILDLIEKNKKITQREISNLINAAVSVINNYLNIYEKKSYIVKKKYSSKNVEYIITKKGVKRLKYLNIDFLNYSQRVYDSARKNLEFFMNKIKNVGYNELILYGAGEVCEIFLNTIDYKNIININVVAVVDDDTTKIGNKIMGKDIISISDLDKFSHDGILISSYKNRKKIIDILKKHNISENKIINFFD